MILTIIFTLTYITLTILLKVVIKSTRLLEKMTILIQETVIMMIFILIFKPKEFPPQFNDFLFENQNNEFFEIKNIKIYKVTLPSKNELSKSKSFNVDINTFKINPNLDDPVLNNEIPLVIVNPVFLKNNDNNFIEKIAVAYSNNN